VARSLCAGFVLGVGLLTVRSVGATTSGLAAIELVQNGQPGIVGLNDPRGTVVSPDGKHVYVNGFQDDDVVAFARDASDGRLTFIEREQDDVNGVTGLRGPTGITISPDGKHVYVASIEDAVVVFSRNPTLGTLTFVDRYKDGVGGVNGLEDLSAITISADGNFVYTAAETEDSVAVFARNATTGELTFVEYERDGVSGVSGIRGASGLALSPDGTSLYVTGRLDNAVALFSRNGINGKITFVGKVLDNVAGVDGLDHPGGVAVSPDGLNVYVAGAGDGAVAGFARNPVTGALGFIEIVPGIAGALGVTVSPDGADVYVIGADIVSVLNRDAGSGVLTRRNDEHVGQSGGIGESPDGMHLYVSSGASRGVRSFRRTTVACSPTPLETCFLPAPRKPKLFLNNNPGADDSNAMAWRWQMLSGADVSQYGAVTSTNDFVLCVYDQSADPQPIMNALIPAGGACGFRSCWKQIGAGGYRYTDTERQPDGVSHFALKAGAGTGRIKAKGAGGNIPLPDLPRTPPVRVQLQAANGNCWDSTFSAPAVNLSTKFKARGD
jgi:DNA-binding beta-propeller fold protein YncE